MKLKDVVLPQFNNIKRVYTYLVERALPQWRPEHAILSVVDLIQTHFLLQPGLARYDRKAYFLQLHASVSKIVFVGALQLLSPSGYVLLAALDVNVFSFFFFCPWVLATHSEYADLFLLCYHRFDLDRSQLFFLEWRDLQVTHTLSFMHLFV